MFTRQRAVWLCALMCVCLHGVGAEIGSCPEHSQPAVGGSECVCNAGYFSQRTCQDNLSWVDFEGRTCAHYDLKGWCAEGTYGPMAYWYPSQHWFWSEFGVDGVDATHACCACGSRFNSSACVPCWQNSYKETMGNSPELCETCAFGNYTSVVGSETCSTCDAGYHTTQITPTLTCGTVPPRHCNSTCTPSSGATSGNISDGDGYYENNEDCWWLLSASPGVEISI